jgi:hypothetical protein
MARCGNINLSRSRYNRKLFFCQRKVTPQAATSPACAHGALRPAARKRGIVIVRHIAFLTDFLFCRNDLRFHMRHVDGPDGDALDDKEGVVAAAARDGGEQHDAQRISHTSHLTPHTSHLTPHTSHLTPHTSHLTPHTTHLTPHTSHLTPHTSHLTPHTSHLTPHTSHLTPHTPAHAHLPQQLDARCPADT